MAVDQSAVRWESLKIQRLWQWCRSRIDRSSRALFGDGWAFEYALIFLVVTYTAIFSIYTYDSYLSLRTGFFDFGQVIQYVYLASHGHFTSFVTGRPIFLVIAPFFAVFPTPATLCVVQSFMLGIGAIPVYLLAKEQLGRKSYALALSALYLLFPALWGANAYLFHDLSLSISLFLFAVYFYEQRRSVGFVASVLLALSCNEFSVIIVLFIAIGIVVDWLLGRSRQKLAFAVIAVLLVVAWAAYLQLGSVALANYQLATTSTTGYTLTGSSSFISPGALTNNVLSNLGYNFPKKIEFLVYLMAPLLFLPLLSPRRLIPALPWLAITLLYNPALANSGIGSVYFIFAQWSSYLIPFLFVAAIPGLRKLTEREVPRVIGHRRMTHALALMFVVTIGISLAVGAFSPFTQSQTLSIGDNTVPLDVSPNANFHGVWPEPVPYLNVIRSVAAEIPQNYSVLTQNSLGSILWQRTSPVVIFYQPGYGNVHEDAILVDTDLPGVCNSCLTQILSTTNYTLYTSYTTPAISLYILSSLVSDAAPARVASP